MPPPPPSVAVDQNRLRDLAERTSSLGARIAEQEQHLRWRTPPGAADVGGFGVAAAYSQFHDQWTAQLHILAGAVTQVAEALHRIAGEYAQSDIRGGQRLR